MRFIKWLATLSWSWNASQDYVHSDRKQKLVACDHCWKEYKQRKLKQHTKRVNLGCPHREWLAKRQGKLICLMSYVLCLMYYVLCIYVLCLMSYVLCLMSYVLCLMSYVLFFTGRAFGPACFIVILDASCLMRVNLSCIQDTEDTCFIKPQPCL